LNRSPYISNAPSVQTVMLKVLLALIPGILAYVWVYGTSILITLSLASLTAVATEAILLKWRGRPVTPFVTDLSAIVTAWLLALALPPIAPWWLIVVGVFFAIVVAKQLYGGLGYNPFNPAMVGYAVLLISFPLIMTKWPAPLSLASTSLTLSDQWQWVLYGLLPSNTQLDAITSATPLDYVKTQLMINQEINSIVEAPIFGILGGKSQEIIPLAYLIGGVYLIKERIITWHLPVAFLGTLALLSTVFFISDTTYFLGPFFHLMTGASMLCAFFIITDPVSGPTTQHGKLYFAAGVAILTYLIRVYGGYPDGVAFAVLIMNMCVPLIDAVTQPRVFGHPKS
jgi:electron transport complex protein RnfD